MKNMKRILLLWMLFVSISLSAQDWAVKTNLLYDATATINLGVEKGLSSKWSIDLSANFNGWTFSDNKKWKHWLVQPTALSFKLRRRYIIPPPTSYGKQELWYN